MAVLRQLALYLGGIVVVPFLIVHGVIGWHRQYRSELPYWRNGIGLTAFVFVALNWFWLVLSFVKFYWSGPTAPTGFINGWEFMWIQGLLVYCTLTSIVFALALKGRARFQVPAASILLVAAQVLTLSYHYY